MTSSVVVSTNNGIASVMLNRPDAFNALDLEMGQAMAHDLVALGSDPRVRGIVISGSGKAFCAGGDLKWALSSDTGVAAAFHELAGHFHLAITEIRRTPKPVIAAVNGVAVGGGFELALACDVIVAAEHAEFGFPEPRVGRMAMDGGMHRLVRHVPLKIAMGMLLTGRRITAAEALRIGLVNEVVPLAKLMEAAHAWADEILSGAPLSVHATKEMTLAGLGLPLPEAMSLLTPAARRALDSEDQTEGVQAFRERRPPQWKGR